MISWPNNCDSGTDGENMICENLQAGFDYLASNSDDLVLFTEDLAVFNSDVLLELSHLSTLVYLLIILSVSYLVVRWVFKLISDIVLGW